MKASISTILAGVVAAGALGAVGYKSVTGDCVFGSCSTSADPSIADPAGTQLVGLAGSDTMGHDAQDQAARSEHCADAATQCPMPVQLVKGECEADASQCDADQPTELIALTVAGGAAHELCCEDGTGACCAGDRPQCEPAAATDQPAGEG